MTVTCLTITLGKAAHVTEQGSNPAPIQCVQFARSPTDLPPIYSPKKQSKVFPILCMCAYTMCEVLTSSPG